MNRYYSRVVRLTIPQQQYRTGASGYIGGEVLYSLHTAHPEFEYVLLVRDEQKAEQVSKAYPKARIVLGDLDSTALLEDEARKADIVVRK